MRSAWLLNIRQKAGKHRPLSTSRRMAFEPLEGRQLLSGIGLNPIANVRLAAGSTMYIPLQGSDAGRAIHYSITSADYSKLTPVMMPSTNKSVRMNVLINGVDQPMTFQLFDNLAPITSSHIEKLVQEGFYNGLQIYRNGKLSDGITPFVIQGGNQPPTGQIKAPTADAGNIAEEFNPNLQYTTPDLLAMARTSSPGTNSTEFFVSEGAWRWLDYNYSIFGMLTTGSKGIQAISGLPIETTTYMGYLLNPVTISSASLFTDTQNGVLQLQAPTGVTGTVRVTVTASDGTNPPTSHTFNVTIQADLSSPANLWAGDVPATPSSAAFVPPVGGSTQSTGLNNSSSATALKFNVTNVNPGDKVVILADGNVIGQATATGRSVTVTTDGKITLAVGPHTITAIQIAPSQTVNIAEISPTGTTFLSQTADVPGYNSPAMSLTVTGSQPALPVVQSLGRQNGPASGGNSVAIRGRNLGGATAVFFGSNPARILSVSDTLVMVVDPAGTGTIDVRVVTPNGESAKAAADRFTYLAPPRQSNAAATKSTDKLRLSVVDQLMRIR